MLDRSGGPAEEEAFVARVAALQPDVVIDNICYTAESCRKLVEGLAGSRYQSHCASSFCGMCMAVFEPCS